MRVGKMKLKVVALACAVVSIASPVFAQTAPSIVGQWVTIDSQGRRSDCPYTFQPDGSFTTCHDGVRGEWRQDNRQVTMLMFDNRTRWLGTLNGDRLETLSVQTNGYSGSSTFVRR